MDNSTVCDSGGLSVSKIEKGLIKLLKCVHNNQSIATCWSEPSLVEYLHRSEVRFLKEGALLELPLSEKGVIVVGDLHGSILDLLAVFTNIGTPPYTNYLFLGDYIGVGTHQLEVILLVLLLKLRWPEHVHLLRGKHETCEVNLNDGFRNVCEETFPNTQIFYRFNSLFDCLPLAAILNDKVLCCHGGVSRWMTTRDSIRQLPRPIHPNTTTLIQYCLFTDLLWAHPDITQSRPFRPSQRDISYSFNANGLDAVLKSMQVTALIRGDTTQGYIQQIPYKCYSITTTTQSLDTDSYGGVLGVRYDANTLHIQPILHKDNKLKSILKYSEQLIALLEQALLTDYQAPLGALTCSRCDIHIQHGIETIPRTVSHIELAHWVMLYVKHQVIAHLIDQEIGIDDVAGLALRLVDIYPLCFDISHGEGGTFQVGLTHNQWIVVKQYNDGMEVDKRSHSTALANVGIGMQLRKAVCLDVTKMDHSNTGEMEKDENANMTRMYVTDDELRDKVLANLHTMLSTIHNITSASSETSTVSTSSIKK